MAATARASQSAHQFSAISTSAFTPKLAVTSISFTGPAFHHYATIAAISTTRWDTLSPMFTEYPPALIIGFVLVRFYMYIARD
ncbi:hypothetical protein CPB86DRAFT_784027 [Serendipita vermifera]|nr:hypothetical protein CPB86DRAFT_784027 [Serendipita vermifera]